MEKKTKIIYFVLPPRKNQYTDNDVLRELAKSLNISTENARNKIESVRNLSVRHFLTHNIVIAISNSSRIATFKMGQTNNMVELGYYFDSGTPVILRSEGDKF